jgi:hypothetical protein
MPHSDNVDALAELLYRAEHHELGVAPPFDRLTTVRREEYRRKATFLSSRGVVVPAAVAAALADALEDGRTADAEALREKLERIAREGTPPG